MKPLKGPLPTAEMFALQYPVRAAFAHCRPPHDVFPPSLRGRVWAAPTCWTRRARKADGLRAASLPAVSG
jgi:hypothetical protein